MVQKMSLCLLILALAIHSSYGLTCTGDFIKVTIKTPTPEEIDQYEQYLFQGVMAYAVRKFCGEPLTDPIAIAECTKASHLTDTSDVTIKNVTNRFAMCVSVTGCTPRLLQEAIKTSQPQFNGALMQTDETLLYDGVPVILKPQVEPDFPTWLIPYIVFMVLVVLAAIAIISFTVYKSKKKARMIKTMMDEADEDSLSQRAYENGGYRTGDSPTVTEM